MADRPVQRRRSARLGGVIANPNTDRSQKKNSKGSATVKPRSLRSNASTRQQEHLVAEEIQLISVLPPSKTPSASKKSAKKPSTFVSLSSSGTATSLDDENNSSNRRLVSSESHPATRTSRSKAYSSPPHSSTSKKRKISQSSSSLPQKQHKKKRCSSPTTTDAAVPVGVVDLDRLYRDGLLPSPVATAAHPAVWHCSWGDVSNLSFLSHYSSEYYQRLFVTEGPLPLPKSRRKIRGPLSTDTGVPNYMKQQVNLGLRMRGILVDWLIEISDEYKLNGSTLHLAVKLVDRALDHIVIRSSQLQCLGCACMLIAGKIEEIKSLTTEDFVYVSDKTYTKKEIAKMELDICTALSFRLECVTPYHFLNRFLQASDCCSGNRANPTLYAMTGYFLELGLLQSEFVDLTPSVLTASAMYLARATLGLRDGEGRIWSKTLEHYTTYNIQALESTVLKIHTAQTRAHDTDLKCIVTKYKRSVFFEVALRPPLLEEDLGFY